MLPRRPSSIPPLSNASEDHLPADKQHDWKMILYRAPLRLSSDLASYLCSGSWIVAREDRQLLAIMCLAFLLRLIAIVAFPSLYHPDENFQFFEQSHRIAFGYGIKPWEFSDGIRSLFFPSIFARIFLILAALNPAPRFYITTSRVILAGMSLPAVAAVFNMAKRSSQMHAFVVGLVAATWFELVYFASRPLTEAIATDFLLVGLALASVSDIEYSWRRLFGVGFCVSMTLMLRVHLITGIAVLTIWVCKNKLRERWVPLLVGAIPPLLAFGTSDLIAWGYPFRSYVQAIRINVIQGKASLYGVEPFYWYFKEMNRIWAGVFPLLAILSISRFRKSGLWLAVSLTIILTHSILSHKEYRFVYPAFVCIVLVASMASADIIQRLTNFLRKRKGSHFPLGLGITWVTVSVSLAFAPGFRDNWYKGSSLITTFYNLYNEPNLCGVLLYDHSWVVTGGYAYFHRNVPIYSTILDSDSVKRASPAFNYVILKRPSVPDLEPDFSLQSCDSSDVCIMKRPGACFATEGLTPLLDEFRLGDLSIKRQSR